LRFWGSEDTSLRQETPALQPLIEQFPTGINRENIAGNREFLSANREFHCKHRAIGFDRTSISRGKV
jgi:hypothetical protein